MELEPWEIPPDILDAPRELAALGYGPRLRPLDGKKPAFKERGAFTIARLEWLVRQNLNLGMRLWDGLAVLDLDGPDQGPFRDLESPMTVRTTRGEHRYFRTDADRKNRMHPGGLDVDVLFHAVPPVPHSIHPESGHRYEWLTGPVPMDDLPLFPAEILREFEPPAPERVARVSQRGIAGHIRDVRAYVSRIVAVEGQGGDRATFRVACIIAKATGGSYHETLARLRDWNATNAHPQWTEKELAHKARCAVRAAALAA